MMRNDISLSSPSAKSGIWRSNGFCVFLYFASLFCLSIFSACGNIESEEILRLSTPDGIVDALLIKKKTGATVATPYEIYIVPVGIGPKGDPILRGDNFENLKLTWAAPRLLEISYGKGRIFAFANFWQSPDVQNSGYVVEVRLRYTE